MIRMMDRITDKDDWDHKIFDEDIVAKWRNEAMGLSADMSEKMLDWVIAELSDKALELRETGMITTLDTSVAIIKSDSTVSQE